MPPSARQKLAASVRFQRSETSYQASGGRMVTESFMYIKQVSEVPLFTSHHIITQQGQGNFCHMISKIQKLFSL